MWFFAEAAAIRGKGRIDESLALFIIRGLNQDGRG
jgi:hypothetical protein